MPTDDYRLPPGRPGGQMPGPKDLESLPPAARIAMQRRMEMGDMGDIGGSTGRGRGAGPSVSVGSVGMPIRSAVNPGQTTGVGVGGRFRMGLAKGGKADAHEPTGGKKRNKAKKYATGGKVSSASKRADGCAVKGKTKGKMV